MKLLVDMDLSPGWVDRLRQHGFEAVHWSTIGAPDDEILAWAGHPDAPSFESCISARLVLLWLRSMK